MCKVDKACGPDVLVPVVWRTDSLCFWFDDAAAEAVVEVARVISSCCCWDGYKDDQEWKSVAIREDNEVFLLSSC